ncbi:SDR family oxidoreductase [Sphingobium sp. DEHP117]|uniref:SDR family NAD(P)-dependent oxidoreductase n=1 Tax=Sphingobium sp. DEHP117 TaxID=2993436 RepID=UPI0027D4EB38|nr:SDR family oxidoreductase [Sphingobium sp. DEHP117]MDQ4421551.1 SDR family oxidoreductase [Sphingobium sp. DEHP117]
MSLDFDAIDRALADPFSLAGKTVLVSGAAGGIGRAAATICVKQQANVIAADVVCESEWRSGCQPELASVPYHRVDASDRAAVDALAARIGPVWAVIDAAGISPLDDWTDENWDAAFDQVLHINTRGPINLARAFMPGMIAAGGGRIVLTGSVAGRMGGIKCGPHYAVSKGGLQSLTRWLAQRGIRDNVLVNMVAPGSIATPMAAAMQIDPLIYPQGRAGRPLEMGATMAFLCSPGAGFIAGAVIDVNGGTYFG